MGGWGGQAVWQQLAATAENVVVVGERPAYKLDWVAAVSDLTTIPRFPLRGPESSRFTLAATR